MATCHILKSLNCGVSVFVSEAESGAGDGAVNEAMRIEEARVALGFPPSFHPSPSQIKAAYKRKVWEAHPDLFPGHEKPHAEHKFKSISEAYNFLKSGVRGDCTNSGYSTTRVVRTGVAMTQGGRRNNALIGVPFLIITLGTVALGGSIATRAYKKQKQAFPSHNPFLP